MREHGECCEPAPNLAERYHTLAGPTIHEGQSVTVAFRGTYRGYDPMLGHHHIEGRWEGVEHLPAYVERLHWAASIKPLTASTDTPASTETARNSDLSDDRAEQAPTDTSTRERASAGDPDEALAKVICAASGDSWIVAARAAREHIEAEKSRMGAALYYGAPARARAERAEAERDEWRSKFEQTDNLLSRTRDERDKYATEAERWEHRHAALREDVEALRRNPKSLTDVLMRAADTLDSDDARDPQAD